MSIDRIHEKVLELIQATPQVSSYRRHLDIGAGRGTLISRLKSALPLESSACDYTDELMRLEGQKVDIANLNDSPLPYPDASFDIVTATEVIEHLEHFRRVVREIHRVLKPGGLCVLSTPNILNLNSRLRFLGFGFWNLFGPLPVAHSALYSTGGHINPVSWFYIAHAMLDAGFQGVTPHIDKVQRSSVAKLILLYPLIWVYSRLAKRKERNRYKTLDVANEPLVDGMNTIDMLLGRTVLVRGVKA